MANKILHYVSVMDRGGEETFIMNVFRTINRPDYLFDFLVTADREGDYDAEIRQLGGKIRHFRLIKKGGPLKRLLNFFSLIKFLHPLHGEYTTFHIHTQHAMDALLDGLAGKLAGFHNVAIHSHSTSTLHHVKSHFLCRPLLNRLPFIRLACSQKAGKWLFGENGKYELICNGVIVDKYLYNAKTGEAVREKEGWGGKTVIGHVGNFTYPKNHEFLLDIFAEYLKLDPDALLVMAGKGELMDSAVQKAARLGIQDSVRFLGSRGDVDRLFSAFDILVFPSRYEGLPVTLVEAQAADLPCLISNTIAEDTDINDNLRRMDLGKPAPEWAAAVKEMLSDQERTDRSEDITKAGFNIQTTAKRLMEIYSS